MTASRFLHHVLGPYACLVRAAVLAVAIVVAGVSLAVAVA